MSEPNDNNRLDPLLARIGDPARPLKEDVGDFIAAHIAILEAQATTKLGDDDE